MAYLTRHKIERSTDLTVKLPGRDFELTREYSSNPNLYPVTSGGNYFWRGASTSDVVPGHVGVNWTTNSFRWLFGDHETSSSPYLRLGGMPLRTTRVFRLVEDSGSVRFAPRASSNQYIYPTQVDIPNIGTSQGVYRLREPGGTETDFARAPATQPTGPNGLGMEDLTGLPIYERDSYGNTWYYEYDILVDNTVNPRDSVVLKSIYLNWDGGSNLNDPSDDTWDARVDYLWNGQAGTSYSGITQWEDTNTNGTWDSGEDANHHFGRLAEVRVVRKDGSSTITTQKVRYTYFDDIKDIVNPDDSNHTLGEQYRATVGDLCQVVVSTLVDSDEGESWDGFYDRVWQYRYYEREQGHFSSLGDIQYDEGGVDHQLMAVFYPEQMEFFADHFAQESIAQSSTLVTAPFGSAVEAADYLRWVSFEDVPGQYTDWYLDDWEEYFQPNEYWHTLFDVASKVISYYGESDGYRVKTQVVNSGDGSSSSCGCGGSVGGYRLGKRFDYLYKRYTWATLPEGVPDQSSRYLEANGYSCQIVESRTAIQFVGMTPYLDYIPYRIKAHDYYWPTNIENGEIGSSAGAGVAWKIADVLAEAKSSWNYSPSTDPFEPANAAAGTGRRWITMYQYTDESSIPGAGETFTAYHKVAKEITPSAVDWENYVPATGAGGGTSAAELPSVLSD
ncbi:MAG: hypothetical protein KC996_00850, partial [Phycisphaerales bacterium]|nr:hypothetical protein [Phycisphaerales bacterium]